MTRLLVCAPLRIEARAVRRGYGGPVMHTGMGPARSARPLNADAVAIAGVCGALDPAMRPGDLVVATELRRRGTATIVCPSAEPLAAELRRAGLTVHTGPIVTVDRPLIGARRAALAGTGACAVDMESAVLARALDAPLAVVRAVVDTPDRPLLRPSTLTGGVAALAALRRIGPALATWAAAVGPRTVVLASPRAAHGPGSDDICYATTNRRQAVRAVAARSDLVLVVGSANCSNSRRLVEVAEQAGTAALLIDDPAGLDLRLLAGARVVGLTAGASAPPAVVDAVIDALGGLGPIEVTEHVVAVENVHFTPPKGVRP